MCDGARNFNPEQAYNAKQKPKEASYEETPYEDPHMMIGSTQQISVDESWERQKKDIP
jgi:hypothetical protein